MRDANDHFFDLTDGEILLLDSWANSYDWRAALDDGSITIEALLAQVEDLERRYPTPENEGGL